MSKNVIDLTQSNRDCLLNALDCFIFSYRSDKAGNKQFKFADRITKQSFMIYNSRLLRPDHENDVLIDRIIDIDNFVRDSSNRHLKLNYLDSQRILTAVELLYLLVTHELYPHNKKIKDIVDNLSDKIAEIILYYRNKNQEGSTHEDN